MHLHAALITVINIMILYVAMVLVGRARARYQVKAPAVSGNVDFERVFRAHQNTLEQTLMFLPALWLATLYCNETYAAWLGYAWLIGRTWYLFGYIRPGGNRSAGFGISMAATTLLLGWSLFCIAGRLLGMSGVG